DEEYLGVQVGGNGKSEAHAHARRIALDRRVDEPLDSGERDDRITLALNLFPAHSHDRAVEVDVLAPGQLIIKAGADLETRGDADPRHYRARGRVGDAG